MTRLLFLALIALFIPSLAAAGPLPPAGDYECRIDKGYKYRPCTVDEAGITQLQFDGGFVGVKGRLGPINDSKSKVFFEGTLTDARPFGCFSCNAKCSEPGATCGCSEIPPAGSAQCLAQPMNAALKKKGRTWSGTLPQQVYSVVYEPLKKGQRPMDRAVIGFTYEIHLHKFDIRKKR
jgi:hypothetical protein